MSIVPSKPPKKLIIITIRIFNRMYLFAKFPLSKFIKAKNKIRMTGSEIDTKYVNRNLLFFDNLIIESDSSKRKAKAVIRKNKKSPVITALRSPVKKANKTDQINQPMPNTHNQSTPLIKFWIDSFRFINSFNDIHQYSQSKYKNNYKPTKKHSGRSWTNICRRGSSDYASTNTAILLGVYLFSVKVNYTL